MEVVGGVQTPTRYIEYQKWADGIVLVPGVNPAGVPVPDALLTAMALSPDRVKVRSSVWTAVQLLYTACLEKDTRGEGWGVDSTTEVMVKFAYEIGTGFVICAAPRQVVGGARVQADDRRGMVNILTGEEYTSWPPEGYASFGDSHSHNRMGAFFSGTDDSDELSKPGFHIVAGNYEKKNGEWEYKLALSIVAGGKRYRHKLDLQTMAVSDMEIDDFLDLTWSPQTELHPKVWEYVKTDYPKAWESDGKDGFGRDAKKYDMVPLGFGGRHAWDDWPTTSYESLYEMQRRRERDNDMPPAFMGVTTELSDEVVDEVMADILNPSQTKDAPGQTVMFDTGETHTDKGRIAKQEAWQRKYLKLEIEGMWDAMDRICDLVGDKKKAREVLACALNYTGYFKRVKARKGNA